MGVVPVKSRKLRMNQLVRIPRDGAYSSTLTGLQQPSWKYG